MASKRNVQFNQPEVPSFLKKFKERVGYKEPASVNDKFADSVEHFEEESNVEKADEEPVVVVLKEGDLTAEQVEKYKQEHNDKGNWHTGFTLKLPIIPPVIYAPYTT